MRGVKQVVHRAAEDVKCNLYWRHTYTLLRAVFPLLKLLRPTDYNKLGMDKVYYLLRSARHHLEKNKDDLMDETLFPPKCQITQVDLADGNYEDVDNDKVTGAVDEADDGSDSSDTEED